MDSFDALVTQFGADPLQPDSEGNSILHLLTVGVVRDAEYDFIKQVIIKYKLRLTRNSENRNPLSILRSYQLKGATAIRGQPNYKKMLLEYFEKRIEEDEGFQDSDQSLTEIMEVIMADPKEGEEGSEVLEKVKAKLAEAKGNDGGLKMLVRRNNEGKSSFMLACEQNKSDVALHLLTTFGVKLGLDKVDSRGGNSCLHYACINNNVELARQIFELDQNLGLKWNYQGETPIHLATKNKNLELLQIFEPIKNKCLLIKDVKGENPLFYAARAGSVEIFNWFYNSQLGNVCQDYFKARGEQNYLGQTIEHIVCMTRDLSTSSLEFVEAVKLRPDIKDFYGNLPLYYCLDRNDVPLITHLFKRGKDYFNLRNYSFETIFHVAARKGALDSLKVLIDDLKFGRDELLKKDFKGNTPLHMAAKYAKVQMLEFMMTEGQKEMLEIQNDFGLTVKEVVREKIRTIEERMEKDEKQTNDQTMQDYLSKLNTTLKIINKF